MVASFLTGCESVSYYGQAVRGQASLLLARRPIEAVIDDPGTEPAVREALRRAEALRDFARRALALPVGGRYADYVRLDRDAVVYNVFAAPRFSTAPIAWCYPIAGCVNYRGYFALADAQAKARALEADGFDVHVGGAAAYSTLGWFDDPLLSTFLQRDPAALAELLFHELAHGLLYVPGETMFNESFASFVGREGARRWLEATDAGPAYAALERRHAHRRAFAAAVLAAREALSAGYAALAVDGVSDEAREAGRRRLWEQVRADWRATRGPELAGYDRFFDAPASNARFNTVADYDALIPAFRSLYEREGENLEAFYAAVRSLAEDDAARARWIDAASALGTGAGAERSSTSLTTTPPLGSGATVGAPAVGP